MNKGNNSQRASGRHNMIQTFGFDISQGDRFEINDKIDGVCENKLQMQRNDQESQKNSSSNFSSNPKENKFMNPGNNTSELEKNSKDSEKQQTETKVQSKVLTSQMNSLSNNLSSNNRNVDNGSSNESALNKKGSSPSQMENFENLEGLAHTKTNMRNFGNLGNQNILNIGNDNKSGDNIGGGVINNVLAGGNFNSNLYSNSNNNSNNTSNNNSNNQASDNDVDLEFLFNMINQSAEMNNMINAYNENFNEGGKMDNQGMSNTGMGNNIGEVGNLGNNPGNPTQNLKKISQGQAEFIHKKPKAPRAGKSSKRESNADILNCSLNNNNGTGSNESLCSGNSNNVNDNINNTNFFNKYNAMKQLDDTKLNSLKYNLLNKNIDNSCLDNLLSNSGLVNILEIGNNNNIGNLSNVNNVNNANSNNVNNDFRNYQDFFNLGGNGPDNKRMNTQNQNKKPKINSGSNNVNLEDLYLKLFLLNKTSNLLANSDLNEKIFLFNMLFNNPNAGGSSNRSKMSDINNVNNFANIQQNINSFDGDKINTILGSNNTGANTNKGGNVSTFEKNFQKEVVKCTVENFCKYLKTNGYTIVKKPPQKEEIINNRSNNGQGDFIGNFIEPPDGIVNDEEDYDNCSNNNPATHSSRSKGLGCPHAGKKHYAKNMCNNCYHRQGRVKKAWLCPHSESIHYARGKCRNCYLNSYHKEHRNKKKQCTKEMKSASNNNEYSNSNNNLNQSNSAITYTGRKLKRNCEEGDENFEGNNDQNFGN